MLSLPATLVGRREHLDPQTLEEEKKTRNTEDGMRQTPLDSERR